MPLGKGVSLELISAQDLVAEFGGHFERSISRAIGHASRSLLIAKENEFELEPSEVSQIFLFALWLTTPTRAHTKWRFAWAEPGTALVTAIHSWFQHNLAEPVVELAESDLETVRSLMPLLARVTRDSPRLRLSLAFSLRGCETFDWAVSLVCYSAALEHLLTYSEAGGLTKRLARAYAGIVATEPDDRDLAHDQFKRVYTYRSDIVHGRSSRHSEASANLAKLAEVQAVVRRLWQAVLADPVVQAALAGDDATRAAYFKQLGYSGPPTQNARDKKAPRP